MPRPHFTRHMLCIVMTLEVHGTAVERCTSPSETVATTRACQASTTTAAQMAPTLCCTVSPPPSSQFISLVHATHEPKPNPKLHDLSVYSMARCEERAKHDTDGSADPLDAP